jgi:ubiquinone/menaquinone biosynthesis C-methylase UbiE
MSRPAQIRFLSRVARVYDPVVRLMGFPPLWQAMGDIAAPGAGEVALDVCTGTGGVALDLARRGARVIGIDLAGGMLRQAGHKDNNGAASRPHFVQMDARHLAFADRAFSLVTCAMALHEMAETERAQVLGEIRRVAGDRAVLAEYRVPQRRHRRALFRASHAFEYAESDDFTSFLNRDFATRLEQAGFVVGDVHDVGAYRIWRCRVAS